MGATVLLAVTLSAVFGGAMGAKPAYRPVNPLHKLAGNKSDVRPVRKMVIRPHRQNGSCQGAVLIVAFRSRDNSR
jgi:hypothetical protein